jgi:DNA-binding NarL/FixJ family response regulator
MLVAMIVEDEPSERDSAEAKGPSPSPEGPDGVIAAKPRILLVEDDYLVGMEIEAGLRDAGCEVIGVAVTAEQAVMLAEAGRPRLVVMDIRLAGDRDGIDAALEIHRRLGIRSLFASAHGDEDVRARATAAEPLGWIGKPYRVPALVRAVKDALGRLDRDPAPEPRPES